MHVAFSRGVACGSTASATRRFLKDTRMGTPSISRAARTDGEGAAGQQLAADGDVAFRVKETARPPDLSDSSLRM
jgi:hypothetical protein